MSWPRTAAGCARALIGVLAVTAHCAQASQQEACDEVVTLLQRFRRSPSAEPVSLQDAAARAASLARELTREEIQGLIRGTGYADSVYNPPPGFFVGNTDPVPRKGIPSLNLQDNGQGYRTVQPVQIGQATSFPSTLAVAATWDESLGRAWGEALGKEFLTKGANVLLGPALNVHRVARGGRNVEYLSGESPYLGARLVKGYIEGVHSQNVLTVMKHFITNNQETNRNTVNSIVDDRTLWEVYYPPFVASVEAGCLQAMCSYNLVNGDHACSNPDILLRDLKESMNYQGAVMSDWWALHSFSAAEGLDMEMPGNSIEGNPLNQAYFTPNNTAELSMEKLQDMAARILIGVVRYGLMERPACTPAAGGCHKEIYELVSTSEAHKELATKIVADSVILLKNENDVLPFAEGLQTIALLGSVCNASNDVDAMLATWDLGNYYTVGGSGRVIPDQPSTILEATAAYCAKAGCQVVTELEDDVEAALLVAEKADVALLCSAATAAEGRDRESLSVDQEAYVLAVSAKLSIPKVSVSLIPGSIVMPWAQDVDAAVALFLAGEATGKGLLQVLSGEVNPAAKSPVTFPLSENDAIPPCTEVECEYTEGVWAGFPIYEDKEVSFPFGHGLSYTTFSYELQALSTSCDDAAVESAVCAEVDLINSGPTAGAEVVQLYLGYPTEAKLPQKLLKAFRKAMIAASGAATLKLPLSRKDISTWSSESKEWVLVDGTYTIFIGSSSRDIRATAKFTALDGEISFSAEESVPSEDV